MATAPKAAFARLAFPARNPLRVYTPHGGSLWFEPDTLAGKIYLTTEKLLMRRRSLYIFESAFSARAFGRKIGKPRGPVRIVHNGVAKAEFEPIAAAPDASDLVFLGNSRAQGHRHSHRGAGAIARRQPQHHRDPGRRWPGQCSPACIGRATWPYMAAYVSCRRCRPGVLWRSAAFS